MSLLSFFLFLLFVRMRCFYRGDSITPAQFELLVFLSLNPLSLQFQAVENRLKEKSLTTIQVFDLKLTTDVL